jgi:hypothetical protein
VDCETTVARCDGVVLVGGRISDGMIREVNAACWSGDLTWLGDEPPLIVEGKSFQDLTSDLAPYRAIGAIP